ncbi:MAG: hypothetical protein V4616_10060 [Bacteroidota bacterium]
MVRAPSFKDSISGFYDADSNFVFHGPYRQYYQDEVYVEGDYSLGVRSGFWKKYYQGGRLCTKGMYVNGKPHGSWKYFYSTDVLASVFFFNNGVKTGIWVGYGFNGKKIYSSEFDEQGNLLRASYFRDNGNIAGDEVFSYRGTDTIINIKRFYPSGDLYEELKLINNKESGNYFKYYPDNKLWEHLEYDNGRVTNVLSMKSMFGKDLVYTVPDKNILLQRFHQNGDVWTRVTGSSMEDTVVYTYYDKREVMSSSGKFFGSKPVSRWVFSNYGKKSAVLYFKDGFEHYINADSEVDLTNNGDVEYYRGRRTGQRIKMDEYKSKIQEVNYAHGYLHGPYWSVSKGIIAEGEMRYGNRVGKWKFSNVNTRAHLYTKTYNCEPTLDTSLIYREKTPEFYLGNACLSDFDFEYPVRDYNFYQDHQGARDNILYNRFFPKEAYEKVVTGHIELHYKVGIMGELYDFKVVRGIGYQCEEEVIRLMKNMPYLRPGMLCGIPMETYEWSSLYFSHPKENETD